MPNYKSLKTYSKTQKVVNYSTLFDNKNEPYKFDSSESSSQSSEQAKETNQLIETEKKPLAKGNYKKKSKKSLLKLPMNDELPEFSPIIPEVDLKSRKNKKTDKAKAFKLFDMSNADSNSSSASSLTSNNEAIQNSTNQDKSNTCNDLMEANNEKTTAKSEEAPNSRVRPKRIISSSSVNSLKQLEPTVPRTRVKVAQKENKIESKSGRVKKSKSTSNILTTKKIQLISSDENRSDLATDVSKIKSIMKSRVEEDNNDGDENKMDKKDNKKQPVTKVKKAVKILEQIDDKNDQISNFKIDNRVKHAASTSTPSGLRRKPLKMSNEVSIIVTPGKKE